MPNAPAHSRSSCVTPWSVAALALLVAASVGASGCSSDEGSSLGDALPSVDSGGPAADAGSRDAVSGEDAAPGQDATEVLDAGGANDAEPGGDAVAGRDVIPGEDARVGEDGAAPIDSGPTDAGSSSADASAPDASMCGTRGTCQTSADCGGLACVTIPAGDPNGWRTCETSLPTEATMCLGMGFDHCCTSASCTAGPNGACFEGPLFYCGGAPPIPANVCVYDECATDASCGSSPGQLGLCIPGGTFGELRSYCTHGDCRADTDCTSRSGGLCVPFVAPCTRRVSGFFCTYDDSECRTDADCGHVPFGYCAQGTDGHSTCESFIPPP